MDQVPRVKVDCSKIVLDWGSNEKVWDVVSDECFSTSDGYLATKSTVNGGIAWIQSRLADGVTLVSNTQMVVNNSLLDIYQGATQQNAAMVSYGCKGSRYLTPGSDRYAAGGGGGMNP